MLFSRQEMKRKYIDYNCNTMIFGKLNISGIVFFVSYIFEMIEEKRSSPIPIYLYKKYLIF